ncbi:hypothetical protein [Mesorhizobium sp. M0859]|uniref:hypothetical protein n=1 Tax=Mesorhizobium sp. M0859 TaxID=2957014 RepID=UPI00333ADE7B
MERLGLAKHQRLDAGALHQVSCALAVDKAGHGISSNALESDADAAAFGLSVASVPPWSSFFLEALFTLRVRRRETKKAAANHGFQRDEWSVSNAYSVSSEVSSAVSAASFAAFLSSAACKASVACGEAGVVATTAIA